MFGKKKQERVYDDDDGRVIADMNIEGMPWYRKDRKEKKPGQEPIDLTKEESRAITAGMLKAGFLVAGVFIGVYLLFILFCVFVWLR